MQYALLNASTRKRSVMNFVLAQYILKLFWWELSAKFSDGGLRFINMRKEYARSHDSLLICRSKILYRSQVFGMCPGLASGYSHQQR